MSKVYYWTKLLADHEGMPSLDVVVYGRNRSNVEFTLRQALTAGVQAGIRRGTEGGEAWGVSVSTSGMRKVGDGEWINNGDITGMFYSQFPSEVLTATLNALRANGEEVEAP